MKEAVRISGDNLSAEIFLPDDPEGYYRGTRFDRSGIFSSLISGGKELAGQWFESYDPLMHDAVKGPAEEFTETGFDSCVPGECFLKTGVGLLRRPDSQPYDRFRLYEMVDPGVWEVEKSEGGILFRQHLDRDGFAYIYEKEILLGEDLRIRHRLLNEGSRTLEGEVYNHNFFTFGRLETTPDRQIDFSFRPEGEWRAVYDSVRLTGNGIRFTRPLEKGESVYMGDLRSAGGVTPCDITLKESSCGRSVRISSDRYLSHIVFWANHRIACVEPYIPYFIVPGEEFRFTVKYIFG